MAVCMASIQREPAGPSGRDSQAEARPTQMETAADARASSAACLGHSRTSQAPPRAVGAPRITTPMPPRVSCATLAAEGAARQKTVRDAVTSNVRLAVVSALAACTKPEPAPTAVPATAIASPAPVRSEMPSSAPRSQRARSKLAVMSSRLPSDATRNVVSTAGGSNGTALGRSARPKQTRVASDQTRADATTASSDTAAAGAVRSRLAEPSPAMQSRGATVHRPSPAAAAAWSTASPASAPSVGTYKPAPRIKRESGFLALSSNGSGRALAKRRRLQRTRSGTHKSPQRTDPSWPPSTWRAMYPAATVGMSQPVPRFTSSTLTSSGPWAKFARERVPGSPHRCHGHRYRLVQNEQVMSAAVQPEFSPEVRENEEELRPRYQRLASRPSVYLQVRRQRTHHPHLRHRGDRYLQAR